MSYDDRSAFELEVLGQHEGDDGTGLGPLERLTRGQLLALAGGAVLLGTAGCQFDEDGETANFSTAAAPEPVHAYVSRPDLKPPKISILHRANGVGRGLLFLAPSSGPGQRGALIVDDTGQPVWFRSTTPNTTMDFRAGFYKRRPVLTWWEGRHEKGVGLKGAYIVADASYREIARFKSRNDMRPDFHEFLLTPTGTALVTSYDPVPQNLTAVGGKANGRAYDGVVQELAIPSGRVLSEWRSLEHVGIEESYQDQIGDPYDYFHVNSIGFDSDGHLLVSARNTWTIYKIHKRTGRVIWRLGGKKSDFAMGPGTTFAFQHDARSHDRGRLISLFDNGPHPKTKPRSQGLVLELDVKRMRATAARRIIHSAPLYARVTGNTQFLPNGNTLICWGNTGFFTEYGADGKVRFDAKLPKGGQNYRVFRFPWVGRPADPPKLVARGSGSGARLYVSWNGATEVASWQVRTGTTRANLAAGPRSPKRGFETSLAVPAGARYAAVVALDGSGKPLGTSNIVRL